MVTGPPRTTHEEGTRAVLISQRTEWWGEHLSEMHNKNEGDQGHTYPTFLASGPINISG